MKSKEFTISVEIFLPNCTSKNPTIHLISTHEFKGELIVEELFKLGQCSMSNVLFRAAKRMKLAKKEEVGFSVKATLTGM